MAAKKTTAVPKSVWIAFCRECCRDLSNWYERRSDAKGVADGCCGDTIVRRFALVPEAKRAARKAAR